MHEMWGPNYPQTAKAQEDPRYGRGCLAHHLPAHSTIPVKHSDEGARPHRPHLDCEVWTVAALEIIEVSRLSTLSIPV